MTQTKNLVIFARAWTSSPPRKTPPGPNSMQGKLQRELSVERSSSSSGTTTPSSITSASSASTTATSASTLLQPTLIRAPPKNTLEYSSLEGIFAQLSAKPSEPSSLWYILTTAVLLSFHKEKFIGGLWTYLSRDVIDNDEQLLTIARHIREACLKASTLVGFPRAINALLSLKSAIDASHPSLSLTLSTDTSLRAPLSQSEKYERGLSFFRQIYRQHTSRVVSAMDVTSGGDLTHFAVNCIYGELLSEDRIIGGLETGLLEFVCCLADGCGPQAKGHFFGSVNLGASNDTMCATILLTEEVARQLGMACPWKVEGESEEFKFLERAMPTPDEIDQ